MQRSEQNGRAGVFCHSTGLPQIGHFVRFVVVMIIVYSRTKREKGILRVGVQAVATQVEMFLMLGTNSLDNTYESTNRSRARSGADLIEATWRSDLAPKHSSLQEHKSYRNRRATIRRCTAKSSTVFGIPAALTN